MRILIFSAYYEPEFAASLYLSKQLYEGMAELGWTVNLYVPLPTRGIDTSIRNYYKKQKREQLINGRLTIHRFYAPKEGKSVLARALRYFYINMVFAGIGLFKKQDVLFLQSTPPTQGLVGAFIRFFRRKPFVYNLQDIFPDSLVASGLTKYNSFLWKIGRRIENITYKSASKIIVISDDFKKNLLSKKVAEDKIRVIYNWVDEKVVHPIAKEDNFLFEEFQLSRNKFYIVYAGNLGKAQNINIIIEAAKQFLEYKDIEFLIFGTEQQSKPYIDSLDNIKITNLRFLPLQSYDKVSYVYSLADVSVVSCKKGFGGSAMPSKTWSILASGTPVVANFDSHSDLQKIIEDNQVGLFSEAEDLRAFVSSIQTLYQNRELCSQLGRNARNYIVENLSREISVSRYLKVIEDLVRN